METMCGFVFAGGGGGREREREPESEELEWSSYLQQERSFLQAQRQESQLQPNCSLNQQSWISHLKNRRPEHQEGERETKLSNKAAIHKEIDSNTL